MQIQFETTSSYGRLQSMKDCMEEIKPVVVLRIFMLKMTVAINF